MTKELRRQKDKRSEEKTMNVDENAFSRGNAADLQQPQHCNGSEKLL